MHKNPAKYFDEILKVLAKDYDNSFTFEELARKIYPKKYFISIPNGKFDFNESVNDKLILNLTNALKFLNNEKLVYANFNDKSVCISTSGFIKIKTKGFEKEILDLKINFFLQRFAWIVTPIAALTTLLITIYRYIQSTS